jgi:EAL domain-containing protein (putative c-di-GMP-specific phosphodiesterase class I)
VDSLLKNADAAMCYAKDQGKNNYQYYNHKMNTSAFEKLMLESNLRKALERDEFSLYYQPKMDVATGAIIGAEALIRWRHPDLGLVSPAEFIPLAEETGLIVPIGEWALRSACAQTRKWHDAGHTSMQVAVNMSSLNFKQENFHRMIAQVVGDSGLPARCLELEMTESLLMQDAEAMVNMLKRLKATGITLSIDDFGTGYSSLSYLKRFPLDALKIDRSFVNDITVNPNDAAITSAIIAMARSLKLNVIAEGVETEAQASLLREQGCQYMQGNLFSRPVPHAEFTALLERAALRRSPRVLETA